MATLNTTQYYDEFVRYAEMSKWQHHNCNLGVIPYEETPYDDDLMKHVHLYDVCERKYAGFSRVLLDMWYDENNHPYAHKMDDERRALVNKLTFPMWELKEWLFAFMVHRLTGSGINYAKNPSGYHNSVLLHFSECDSIEDMCEVIAKFDKPIFTSSGYQIAPFPKPMDGFSKGGVWFMCKILPDLILKLCDFLDKGNKKDFRTIKSFLEEYNQNLGFRVFRFQYGAFLADIADFFPEYINKESHYFYGKNATECLEYLAIKPRGKNKLEFLDSIMDKIVEDTGALPYNAEDIACDAIRWIENYINPKLDYSHLCMDTVWSSHTIKDHPYGRQKAMLELGLVETFNGAGHPSDDKILKEANMTVEEYQNAIKSRI